MNTAIIVSSILGMQAIYVCLWAMLLRGGLRWAGAEHTTTRRVVLAAVLVMLLQTALWLGTAGLPAATPGAALFVAGVQLIGAVLIALVVIVRAFHVSFLRAFLAWLPTLLVPVVMLAVSVFVFRPFVAEAFVTNANSMAPTLLGRYSEVSCPECGAPAFGSGDPDQLRWPGPKPIICSRYHVAEVAHPGGPVLGPDRFLAAKFLKPRRWDLVVFRPPHEPATLHVMRLVGLPGEEITIRDGKVWADGRMLPVPAGLEGIEYVAYLPEFQREAWGAPARPARLADDEYFVLGDFSLRAYDSRLWSETGTGGSPFALPASDVHGVVTHIYWPPGRWRAFR